MENLDFGTIVLLKFPTKEKVKNKKILF